jgi:hypothetical protein
VNWVNWGWNRINCHPYVELLFQLRGPTQVAPWKVSEFQLFRNSFSYTDVVHFVQIQMVDTHNDMQLANLASAAQKNCSFLIRVGS